MIGCSSEFSPNRVSMAVIQKLSWNILSWNFCNHCQASVEPPLLVKRDKAFSAGWEKFPSKPVKIKTKPQSYFLLLSFFHFHPVNLQSISEGVLKRLLMLGNEEWSGTCQVLIPLLCVCFVVSFFVSFLIMLVKESQCELHYHSAKHFPHNSFLCDYTLHIKM